MARARRQKGISRRQMVGIIGLAGAGFAAGYGGLELLDNLTAPSAPLLLQDIPDIVSARIEGEVPAADPDSSLWKKADAAAVALGGQQVIRPLRPQPSVPSVAVRSLHNGQTIAFRLEWTDQREDLHSIKIDQFRDACGVMLGPTGASAGAWTMGNPDEPVTIMQWRADWQKDIDAGFQDLEVAFPNVAFDFYPPLVNAVQPLKLPDAYPENARMWLPGWYSGNPLSQPVKQSPVQKLLAIGPGTLEAHPTQNATGKGAWKDGTWKVALAKPMTGGDQMEIALAPGQEFALAFTVWSGADGDIGSRKSLTQLGKLRVQA